MTFPPGKTTPRVVHLTRQQIAALIGTGSVIGVVGVTVDAPLWLLGVTGGIAAGVFAVMFERSPGQDFRSSDAKPSDQHTQREPAEDATGGTVGPGPAPD